MKTSHRATKDARFASAIALLLSKPAPTHSFPPEDPSEPPKATPSLPGPVPSLSACRPTPAQTRKRPKLPPAAPSARYSSFIDTLIVTPEDLRDPRNNRPHTEIRYDGPPPKTASQASKIRRKAMETCGCRLCALALNPPVTFTEATALGIESASFAKVEAILEPLRAAAKARIDAAKTGRAS